jgi:hypothetical protein
MGLGLRASSLLMPLALAVALLVPGKFFGRRLAAALQVVRFQFSLSLVVALFLPPLMLATLRQFLLPSSSAHHALSRFRMDSDYNYNVLFAH